MNIKTTLILLAILIGIGVYVIVVDSGGPSPTEDGRGRDEALLIDGPYDPEGLESITVRRRDRQYVEQGVLKRDAAGEWMQVEPVRFPMNAIRLQTGLGLVAGKLRYIERFEPGESNKPTLDGLGLAVPAAVITFKGMFNLRHAPAGETSGPQPFEYTIKLGDQITGGRGYAMIGDDPHVYVVNDGLHRILLRERIADWRETRLRSPKPEQTHRIILSHASADAELVQTDGEWRFGGEHDGRVNPRAVRSLLNGVAGAKVGHFYGDNPDALARFGLSDPAIEIMIESAAAPKKRTLRIGNPVDVDALSYYATWSLDEQASPVVFSITRDSKALFEPPLNELRDPRITPIGAAQVRALAVHRPDSPPIELERSAAAGWTFVEATAFAGRFLPDQQEVARWIEAVTTATADLYAPAAESPAETLATITLSSVQPPRDDRLVVYTPSPDLIPAGDQRRFVAVKRNDETTAYLLDARRLGPVFADAIALRNRDVARIDSIDLREIIIKRYDGTVYDFWRDRSDLDYRGVPKWKLRGHERFEVEAFGTLLGVIDPLRAQSWLSKGAAIGDGRVEVRFLPAQPDGQAVTLVADVNTHQADISSLNTDFEVSPQLAALLDAEFRHRVVVDINNAQLEEVAIVKGNGEPGRIMRTDNGQFHAVTATGQRVPNVRIDQRKAAKLFDVLAPLRVLRYIEKPEGLDPKDATLRFELRTKTQRRIIVHVGFEGRPEVGNVEDKWFTLDEQTLKIVTVEASHNLGAAPGKGAQP